METKHTPAPWTVTGNEIRVLNGVPMLLATVNNSEGAKINGYNAEANAKLIAAAPELLEALKLAYDLLEEHQGEAKWYLRGHYNKINAAIKKATE